MIRLYFPATILLQYLNVSKIHRLHQLIEESRAEVLLRFMERSEEDARFRPYLPLLLIRYYQRLRHRLHGLVLGEDVVLYYRKEAPIELGKDEEEYELLLRLDPDLREKLTLRKFRIIDRVLWPHMAIKAYYNINNLFKEKIREIERLTGEIKTLKATCKEAESRQRMKSRLCIVPYNFCRRASIYSPSQLGGVISKVPLMGTSTFFQYALLYALKYDATVAQMIELPGEFLEDAERELKRFHVMYGEVLRNLREALKMILEGAETPIAYVRYKLAEGPLTPIDLLTLSEASGFSYRELYNAIETLRRRGEVIIDPETGQWKLKK